MAQDPNESRSKPALLLAGLVPDPARPTTWPEDGDGKLAGMPERPPLQAGAVLLDRYLLVSRLGRGLGGETWKAEPLDGGEPVAVKIIPANADRRAQRDVLNEAAFLRELDHPHVVRYLGMVDLPGGGATFLIMEFVEGGNLWEWVSHHGPCAPDLAAALLLQIAEGLRAVHGCGILHRDLKPSNVLVRPREGEVPRLLVADLGISRRAVMNVAAITRVAGTPGYAAPEAWSGGTVSSAADIYALGAVGWFLLTGEEPQPNLGSTYLDPYYLPGLIAVDRRAEAAALVDLIGAMLALEAGGRPSIETVCGNLERLAHGLSPAVLREFRAAPPTRSLEGGGPQVTPRPAAHPSIVPDPGPEEGPPRLLPMDPVPRDVEDRAAKASTRQPSGAPPPFDPFEPAVEAPGPRWPWVAGVLLAVVLIIACAGFVGSGWLRESRGAVEAPLPASEPAAASEPEGGEVGRLRVGIRAPNGLPADVALVVSAPGGASNRSLSTQVVVSGARSGKVRVSLVSATTTLGEATVVVPAAPEVRVLCTALAADFSSLQCEVLP